MYPILISIGPVVIYALSVFLLLAWLVFSFLFWRALRSNGVAEERIFDLTFYSTICAIIAARIGFILFHWQVFSGKNPLLLAAVWVAPGFSFTAALLATVAGLFVMAKLYRMRIGMLLDAFAIAIPLPLIIGEIASLLDGTELGKVSGYPWAIRYLGHPGVRHPVQLYEMIGYMFVLSLMVILSRKAYRRKWAYGLVGILFFLLYSQVQFVLEFLKDTRVYWGGLSANQWILIGIFAESLGLWYVHGRVRNNVREMAGAFRNWLDARRRKSHRVEPGSIQTAPDTADTKNP